MTDQDNHLWLQTWRDQNIEFHQLLANKFLTKFWPTLNLVYGSRIFVPLCGKSLDMIWLAEQGHKIVGVELSPIAVRAFFKENKLKHVKRKVGKFTLWENDQISILCGDYFSLTKNELGKIDVVYDRASLTALPEEIRKPYISQLNVIVDKKASVFLLTTEDAEENETLKMSLGISKEIETLYSENYNILLTHVESVFENNTESPNEDPVRTEYKLYQLTGKLSTNLNYYTK